MRCFVLGLALLACACGQASREACPKGLQREQVAQLDFGRNIGALEGVSEADWRAFLDAEVTPRFPAGLTVSEAQGQWRGPDGAIVSERSKALTLVLSGAPGEQDKLDAIRAAYKARFHQDAVLLVEGPACVGF